MFTGFFEPEEQAAKLCRYPGTGSVQGTNRADSLLSK